MTQMNELNATKLSIEELENVNGGTLRRLRQKKGTASQIRPIEEMR